jgi:hypothetical protein
MRNRDRGNTLFSGAQGTNNKAVAVLTIMMCISLAPCFAVAETATPKLDLAISFLGDRTNPVAGSNSWLTGGAIELGADVWRGLGIAADVQGLHVSSIGSQGVPFDMVVTTFGPRYRYTKPISSERRTISAFGQALLGEAIAFHSLFPSSQGTTGSAHSLALQIGGGLDLGLSRHVAVRPVQAAWLHTQFPNGTTNVQNHLQLGAGLVMKF